METNHSSAPLLSIVTINLNNAAGLERTIESVRAQSSGDYEHIIIDGASADQSVAVIRRALADREYASRVPFWCSERDGGLYDALNKGASRARGAYCLFLNSGDVLFDSGTVARIGPLCSAVGADIFYGKCLCFTRECEWVQDYPRTLSLAYLYRASVNHQNCLIRTALQKKRPYRTDYEILADRAFFVRALLEEPELDARYVDFIIAKYECETGVSARNPGKVAAEERRLQRECFPKALRDSFEYLEERERAVQERLDEYEKKHRGVLKSMKSLLDTYSAAKARLGLSARH